MNLQQLISSPFHVFTVDWGDCCIPAPLQKAPTKARHDAQPKFLAML
jgi:hypothetical protein